MLFIGFYPLNTIGITDNYKGDNVILQKSNQGQFYITLPKKLVEAKKWERGIRLNAIFNERGNIELEEKIGSQ